jgi:predicted Fe-Mo cluster-binding NifX family protein
MIIAIATNKQDIKAMVDPHFGRCEWYCLYDIETLESSFIENPVCNNQEKAGCNAAELLVGKNIKIAVAGRFGSKVIEVFRKNNIQMVIPETQKTVAEIINQIK